MGHRVSGGKRRVRRLPQLAQVKWSLQGVRRGLDKMDKTGVGWGWGSGRTPGIQEHAGHSWGCADSEEPEGHLSRDV